ncbi:MAG: hypothetical protein Q8N63_02615, partial [Nanoarchaeota archaeon]|nr:hypothetical protein [Nanoarchaeota archaeon]
MINGKREVKRETKSRGWIIRAVALLFLFSLIFLVSALTDDERADLESELNSLTAELNSQGYSWLTNYSINYPSIEVYRENETVEIVRFTNITQEDWYTIYLTNLSENESYDVFDLRVAGATGIEFDYIVDPVITEDVIATDSELTNITAETGNSNFTHLNISHSVPYFISGGGVSDDILSLVGYWNFDGDKENTKLTTHYDWTSYGNDGTGVGNVVVNLTNCIYGDCLQLDGAGDYVDAGDINAIDVATELTGTAWIKPATFTA